MKGMNIVSRLAIALILVGSLATLAGASAEKPGEGVTVKPGRATWTTGHFQEVVYRKALEELGYEVKKAKDLSNPIFYQAVTQGDIDYWTNGWFPLHYAQLPDNFDEKAQSIGYVAKAGGLSGYLVSKKAADEFGITSLADFKRPEVIKAFDANEDGKADLVACEPGWGCEKVVSHHMDVYGLHDYVKPIKASYTASMADAVARFKDGGNVFFYTWAPNWTIIKMKPGEDVVWINVPEIKPSEAQKGFEDMMTLSGIEGAVSDPIKMGFVANDIRVVANNEFLANNPAAKKLFEIMSISVIDISAQNTKMNEGESSAKDIERHAAEWIENNKEQWDAWLAEARKAAQ